MNTRMKGSEMTSRFRNLSKPLLPFVELAAPQRVRRPSLSTKDKIDLWRALYHDLSTAVRTIKSTNEYALHVGTILGEHLYLCEAKSDNPSYRDLFFVAFHEETYLPVLGYALVFFHTERLEKTTWFSVSDFLLYVVSRRDTIISDKQQSDDGKRLWQSFVRKAYLKGLTVALFDTKKSTYIDISNNPNYVKRNYDKIWGDAEEFSHIRLVVSTKKLKDNQHV